MASLFFLYGNVVFCRIGRFYLGYLLRQNRSCFLDANTGSVFAPHSPCTLAGLQLCHLGQLVAGFALRLAWVSEGVGSPRCGEFGLYGNRFKDSVKVRTRSNYSFTQGDVLGVWDFPEGVRSSPTKYLKDYGSRCCPSKRTIYTR